MVPATAEGELLLAGPVSALPGAIGEGAGPPAGTALEGSSELLS